MKETIIVVEDNPDFGNILSESLAISFPDYDIKWYQTGVAAAEAIDEGLRPIAGMIDTVLPDTHGSNIARYILESVPEAKLIQITGYGSRDFEIEALRYGALDFLLKPFNIHHARNLVEHALERYKISKKKTLLIQDIKMMMEGGQSFQFSSIFSLVTTLEKHSQVLTNISLMITELAQKIGKEMGLIEHEMKVLRYTALLYDMGTITEEESIKSNKSKSTTSETLTMFSIILTVVRSIYEWWDGTGFPNQLKGEEIPLHSRIISVAFGFICLTIERIYHKPFESTEALNILKSFANKQYDPKVINALEKVLAKSE